MKTFTVGAAYSHDSCILIIENRGYNIDNINQMPLNLDANRVFQVLNELPCGTLNIVIKLLIEQELHSHYFVTNPELNNHLLAVYEAYKERIAQQKA